MCRQEAGMAAKSDVDRIVKMLEDEAPERRMAAAIVLGELRAKGPSIIHALRKVVSNDGPMLQRHALEALTRIGAKPALDSIWPLLAHRDESVRGAASEAIASTGENVVSEVRTRLGSAEGAERRALESILAQLGGTEAFDALLEALAVGDEETNRKTALELRRHVKDADSATRRSYRSRLEKFLAKVGKNGSPAESAKAAAVKVLGFLEDPKAAPTLLALAKDRKEPASVRQEALIALRFTMGSGLTNDVVKALVSAASADHRALAQTALMTLAALDLPASMAPALADLALHPDVDRARIAIEKLGALGGGKATETLVEIVGRGDKRRSELAADALKDRSDAIAPLADLLTETEEVERARLIAKVLRPKIGDITPAMRKKLAQAGIERLIDRHDAWEPMVTLASDRDAKATAAQLRDEATKLRKTKKTDAEQRVLSALIRTGDASDEDRYRLASLSLRDSKLDPRMRNADRSVRLLTELAGRGFDVGKALRGDRMVELEHLYYVGFCFLEEGVPLGEELLEDVVKKGGKKKIAAAAKNKLKLAGLS
jgi:HEAT repeat protein